jgi:hypothetical protein
VPKVLQGLVTLFGIVCILIALAHIVVGPASIPGGGEVNTTTDSEERFYAAMFLGFGVALIWCSRDLRGRARAFDALILFFFIGGVARVISVFQFGYPHPFFTFLGGLELVLPPLLWWWRKRAFPQDLPTPPPPIA